MMTMNNKGSIPRAPHLSTYSIVQYNTVQYSTVHYISDVMMTMTPHLSTYLCSSCTPSWSPPLSSTPSSRPAPTSPAHSRSTKLSRAESSRKVTANPSLDIFIWLT